MTNYDRDQIVDILNRRANEIAAFRDQYENDPSRIDAVDLSLAREITRVRVLAERLDKREFGEQK